MMSVRLIVVPMIKPAKPTTLIKKFLKIINAFFDPLVEFQCVQQSKKAGNKMPNVDNANAPINDINNSKFGMATARTTANRMEIQN